MKQICFTVSRNPSYICAKIYLNSDNMINSKTLGIMAIFAASVLVTGALVAAPSYAKGDGNTITKEKNEGKAIASGFGTTAINLQNNCINSLLVSNFGC